MALVLVTGGARSGKSAVAQRLAQQREASGRKVIVAVFGDGSEDEEMGARIDRHREERPSAFRVLEARDASTWRDEVPDDAVLLIECLGTLAGRAVDDMLRVASGSPSASELEAGLDAVLTETVSWLAQRSGDSIVVSNETGWGVVPVHASGRAFRDALGRANTLLTRIADAAYLVVNGRVVDLGALPAQAPWPEE